MHRAVSIMVLAALSTVVFGPALSHAAVKGRVGIHGIYLKPDGDDTETLGDENWGGDIAAVFVPPGLYKNFALSIGLEVVHFGSETIVFREKTTGLRIEQQSSQTMFRIPIGARIGHQGHGSLRPYAGVNFSLNFFNVDTDVVVPDDSDFENEIRQNLSSDTETAAGFDLVLGTELNFSNRWYIDLGVKFIRTFNAPQQLADNLEEINPNYFQVFLGAGVTFATLAEIDDAE